MTSAVVYTPAGTGTLPYLGQVATGTFVPDSLHASNTYSYGRNPHFARDDITSVQIVIPNWYVNASMVETNGTGTATWEASIEYPAGTFTRLTFAGTNIGTVAAGSNLTSDAATVAIPNGAKFWTRIFGITAGKIMYFALYCGDGTAEASYGTSLGTCPNCVMGGTGNSVLGTSGAFAVMPCAIIAQTSKASLGIVGDSISVGRGDLADASCRQGYLARAFGGRNAYMHVGVSGDTLQNFVASHTKRNALLVYVSHIVTEYGSNDLINSRTAAQILADTNTVIGYYAGKPVGVCTIIPRVTTSDAYVTVANQTVTAMEAVRLVVNAQRRNGQTTGLSTAAAIFDVERAAESSYLSGKFQVISGTISPGTATYTDDGVHPNRTGHLAIAGSINPSQLI